MVADDLKPPPKPRRRVLRALTPTPAAEPVAFDEALLNEWLAMWAWHTQQDRGVKGFGQKVPGLQAGAGSRVASEEDASHIYDEADAQRSAVITVIVYHELPEHQRIAVESKYLTSVWKMRDMDETLYQAKCAVARGLIKRGYPL